MSKPKYSGDENICIVTGAPGATKHHIYTQKTYPEYANEPWNQLPLCHRLHMFAHQAGLRALADKYDSVAMWLKKNKWEYSYVFKKWSYCGK